MNTSRFALVAVLCVALGGCASQSRHYFADHPVDPEKVIFVTSTPTAERPRELRMFAAHEGSSGFAVGWDDLLQAIEWADIIILGEQHDDAIAHAVQRSVVEDVVQRWPNSALTLEMLERDEQRLVDDYAEGIIDADAFATLTHSKNWGGGEGTWELWYQPIIDAALNQDSKMHHMDVIAANAPRRYVRAARLDWMGGYDRLRDLPKDRRALIDFPHEPAPAHYWQRFLDVMTEAAEESADEPGETATTQPASQPAAAGHGGAMTAERLERGFRSQLLWDATMAGSIARAKKRGADKVVHLVGQFHSDFQGGTVHEIRKRLPGANILVISMQAAAPPASLREEDRGRADVVIYTGETPEEQPAATAPATQPEPR
jgi:uncharacterized iron-regulated protein